MTEKLYLIGNPTAHSKSPVMQNAVFAEAGLDWCYEARDCASDAEACAFIGEKKYLALNITTPYKPLAFESATVTSAAVKLSRGANVLVRKEDSLLAFNLDGRGCVGYLEHAGFPFADARIVVCGTGPTAFAIAHACAQAGAATVVLASRQADKAEAALGRYLAEYERLAYATFELPPAHAGHLTFRAAFEHARFASGSYASSSDAIGAADLIINATPLGMHAGDPAPFDTALLHSAQTVFDVVYGHGETALATAAKAEGCRFHDGAGMLVMQAVMTVQTVCDISETKISLDTEDMFAIMAEAAGFVL